MLYRITLTYKVAATNAQYHEYIRMKDGDNFDDHIIPIKEKMFMEWSSNPPKITNVTYQKIDEESYEKRIDKFATETRW